MEKTFYSSQLFVISACRGNSSCIPSYYPVESECCPKCSPGQYVRADCSVASSTKCSPCEKGTFNNVFTRLKYCLYCTSCAPDSGLRIASPCTSTRDALCEPLEGFFCTETRGRHCEAAEKHSQCKPGQYIRHNGTALTDTDCADCSAGTFSNGTLSTCQKHTQCENLILLREGTASADAECGEAVSGSNISVVAISVCVLLVAVGGAGALYFLYMKYQSGKGRIVPNSTKKAVKHRLQAVCAETEEMMARGRTSSLSVPCRVNIQF